MAVTFFGGEPLLSFLLIKEIVDYVERTYPHIDHFYKVVTNGTLLTHEKAIFFKKYGFNIIVSIDGSEEKHDFYRKDIKGNGTYKTIMHNLKQTNLLENIIARITITDILVPIP